MDPERSAVGLIAAPRMSLELSEAYKKGAESLKGKDLTRAAIILHEAGERAGTALAAWFFLRCAEVYVEQKRWDDSDKMFGEAIAANAGIQRG